MINPRFKGDSFVDVQRAGNQVAPGMLINAVKRKRFANKSCDNRGAIKKPEVVLPSSSVPEFSADHHAAIPTGRGAQPATEAVIIDEWPNEVLGPAGISRMDEGVLFFIRWHWSRLSGFASISKGERCNSSRDNAQALPKPGSAPQN